MWNGRNWARIIAIVLAVLGILASLGSFNLFGIVLELLIGGYLLLNKDVKDAFN